MKRNGFIAKGFTLLCIFHRCFCQSIKPSGEPGRATDRFLPKRALKINAVVGLQLASETQRADEIFFLLLSTSGARIWLG